MKEGHEKVYRTDSIHEVLGMLPDEGLTTAILREVLSSNHYAADEDI
jgi:hypothetical protein